MHDKGILFDYLEGTYDCCVFNQADIFEWLEMLMDLRHELAKVVQRRAELGVWQGSSPEELCCDVCHALDI